MHVNRFISIVCLRNFRHDSPRVAAYVEADNEQAHQDTLDLLDGKRDIAAARSAIY